MGLRGVETGDGVATLEMAKSPWLCNAVGVIYGGAIAYLADAERGPLCVIPEGAGPVKWAGFRC
jgi:acyl-coenzyme A thioesterase PaaI-like protein